MSVIRFALAGALLLASTLTAAAATLTIQLKDGPVVIELNDKAPQSSKRLLELANKGAFDNVVFHRVIEGFMAQTGDVKYGNATKGYDARRAGMGASDLPNLPPEFTKQPFKRGVVGMARGNAPDTGNSQFFIMFADGDSLNGQYTVVGHVVSGMEAVDKIKRGDGPDGQVTNPDRMLKVTGKP